MEIKGNSSISNSSLIIKIVGFCVLLLAIYNLIIIIFPLNYKNLYTNEDRAEEFVFNNKNYDRVMVGSSLIGGLPCDSFENKGNFFKLYFPYSGSCTGVEMVVRSGKIPKELYVETNYISRGTSQELINNIFGTYSYHLKSNLPSFQNKNKFFKYLIEKVKTNKKEIANDHRPPKELFQSLLDNAILEYSTIPDTNQLLIEINRLNRNLNILQSMGCKIILFEMPFEKELIYSKRQNYLRAKLRTSLDNINFKWIPLDSNYNYATGDGVHLLKEDSGVFMAYFLEKLN